MSKLETDIAIVGGGMVGAATALGLAKLGFQVVLIEGQAPQAYSPEQPLDLRVSAISLGSEQLLARLGVLDHILSQRCAVYDGLETWEFDGWQTAFHAHELGQTHLGHMVENRLIQLGIWQAFTNYDNLTLLCPAKVVAYQRLGQGSIQTQRIQLTLDNQQSITAKLLIGADGAQSQVRQWANIGTTGWGYRQAAMLVNIQTEMVEQTITWQQFTPQGPRALLPLPNQQASLVWYDAPQKIQQLMQCSPEALRQEIIQHFPSRLSPSFTVLARGSFPLTRRHAQQYYQDNLVLVGDAAHSINPLAGQGVNLGFKDVAALLEVLAEAKYASENAGHWWSAPVLKHYQRARYSDNLLMMSGMDLFYQSFKSDFLPLKLLRNAALKVADNSGAIKRQALKYALGLPQGFNSAG